MRTVGVFANPGWAHSDFGYHWRSGHQSGEQDLTLKRMNGAPSWGSSIPSATRNNDKGKPIATHDASPTWQANDGSTVIGGNKVAATVVGAIPWLRLQATLTTAGPDDGDRLLETTWIQRMNMTGGLAPSSGCSSTTLGTEQDVPYTADDYFYELGDDQVAPTCILGEGLP